MRALVILLLSVFMAGAVQAEQKFIRVKPEQYQTKAPSKGYTFTDERAHARSPADPQAQYLKEVRYLPADSKQYALFGVLDTSGKKPVWAVEPKYRAVYPVNEHFSLAKPILDGPYFICKHGTGTCTEGKKIKGDFRQINTTTDGAPAEAGGSSSPSWLAPVMLGDGAGYRTATMTLYSPQGDPIGTLENVALEPTQFSHYIQAVKMGDSAIIRARDETRMTRSSDYENRETFDVALSYLGGEIKQVRLPSFSIVYGLWSLPGAGGDYRTKTKEISDYRYMFTVEPGGGLYFPVYPEGQGFRTAPEDLMGIRPLQRKDLRAFGYRKYPADYATIPANNAEFFDPSLTSAWLARWATPNGMMWAFVRTDEIFPTYDEIIASRDKAAYTDYQPLWDTSIDDAKVARETGLIDRFAFEREDGGFDIFTVGPWRENLWPYIERETQLAAGGLDGYFSRKMAAEAAYRAEAKVNYDNMMAQLAADKIARDRAWAEYHANARRREQEAQARRDEQYRQAQLYWEEQERAAIANQKRLADQFAPDPSVAFWSAFSNSVQSASPGASYSAPVDYWKSYDSTNTTGQYTTSSGAATGCRLGSGSC